jgi:hypothetical protein
MRIDVGHPEVERDVIEKRGIRERERVILKVGAYVEH